MPETIIVNTSCLIALYKINRIDLLCKLYKKVLVPEEVYEEFSSLQLPCMSIVKSKEERKKIFIDVLNLGKGEASAISLALETGNICIIDDLRARKMALNIGIRITGTIGVLLIAEKKGFIQSAYEDLKTLKGKGFYVSEALLKKLKSR